MNNSGLLSSFCQVAVLNFQSYWKKTIRRGFQNRRQTQEKGVDVVEMAAEKYGSGNRKSARSSKTTTKMTYQYGYPNYEAELEDD